ncbi:MAG TPA: hypothetical protein VMW40_06180 [Candidatus Bathyarchaeia archaeon]|nr:hypothetical protein [Candidatus Bathyarchaeia archaeon]
MLQAAKDAQELARKGARVMYGCPDWISVTFPALCDALAIVLYMSSAFNKYECYRCPA